MTCTATIQLGDAVSTCTYDAGHDSDMGGPHYCVSSRVTWWDESPGATPHESGPRFVARHKSMQGMWQVVDVECGWVAEYNEDDHPDPEGAAKAEARRLACHPHDGDESLHGAWVCDSCGVEVERDPSVVNWDEARQALETVKASQDRVAQECDWDEQVELTAIYMRERDAARSAAREWAESYRECRDERDEARTELEREHEKHDATQGHLGDVMAERDHYRQALEDIASRNGDGGWTPWRSSSDIARRTLEGLE